MDELDRLLDEVNNAFRKRNRYVHHTWCRDFETNQVFTKVLEARGEVDAYLVPMSVNEIKADAIFIYGAGMNLMRFLGDRKLLPAFPASPRPRAHKSKAARKERRKRMARGDAPKRSM